MHGEEKIANTETSFFFNILCDDVVILTIMLDSHISVLKQALCNIFMQL